jgi:diguanylate cyclase (GGDEF)-like protein/PAS domain S-box-containing protein
VAVSQRPPSGNPGNTLDAADYRALYEHSPDGVLFTVPNGRVMAANPAACELLKMAEADICGLGRQGLADPADERWGALLAERARLGSVHGVARMLRGDGVAIEVEMSAQIFAGAGGEERTCTIIRDVTERVSLERKLVELTAKLRELALNDELTGLRNRRGFVVVGSYVLELANRQQVEAQVLFLDVDNMKALNDMLGHNAGDCALKAVAQALAQALRRADVVSRIGGDEFVALVLALDKSERDSVEARIRRYLYSAATIAIVGMPVEVSMGWSERAPGTAATVEDMLDDADRAMYLSKTSKQRRQHGATPLDLGLGGPQPALGPSA